MSLAGHLWTVVPRFLQQEVAPPARPWSLTLDDELRGTVNLTGWLRDEADSRSLLVVIHGIGGCAEAAYALRASAAAARAGLSCLRVNLRGCDRRGEDYYHAGLSEDVGRILDAPELAAYDTVYLLGYSLGGHLALRYASGVDVGLPDPRLRAVAAVCAPLDLARSNRVIDSPRLWPYRRFVLSNLMEIYAAVAERREVPIPIKEAVKIRTLFEWDSRVIAERWGFDGAADYYQRASVAPHLSELQVPALFVAAENDPMVPASSLRPVLDAASSALEVVWADRGGHVAFPADLRFGVDAPSGLEDQVLGWLMAQGGSSLAGPAVGYRTRESATTGEATAKEMGA